MRRVKLPHINSMTSCDAIWHYTDIIMSTMVSQTTGVRIVNSTVCLDVDQRKHQSSAWLVFLGSIHRWPVNSPHKGPVTRKMFPFDCVIMIDGQMSKRYISSYLNHCWVVNHSPRNNIRYGRRYSFPMAEICHRYTEQPLKGERGSRIFVK